MSKAAKQNTSQTSTSIIATAKKHYNLCNAEQNLDHDKVIIEEPLQISLAWFNREKNTYQLNELTVTMRTPGDDIALATGFLFAEGVITNQRDIVSINIPSDCDTDNQLEVTLAKHVQVNWQSLTRSFASLSSCGLCGKTSIKSLSLKSQRLINQEKTWLAIAEIPKLIQTLTQQQSMFSQTGGVHGAAIFQQTQWLAMAEDIGRHNAVDKVIGDILLKEAPINQAILLLTGRVSFELMQKAVMAAIPVVIAVGAPSSLAISVAKQFNITLIGFTKASHFNVYHADWRLFDATAGT